ncbi:MAG: FAD-dependent oxidoreductase [Planctomycetota bacterium]|nr:FAD-dependent oxidoreductase [Planctomycetota bacterium]
MVIILGAGLAGLSAAHHLDEVDRLVLDRENEVGGLCRSIREDGFTFDYTGHLLHIRDQEIRQWVLELMPDAWNHLHRSAWIHSHDVLTPYPFQANTADLPTDVRLECLLGFVQTLVDKNDRKSPIPEAKPLRADLPHLSICPAPSPDEPNFKDWVMGTFGAGFAKHFFTPYNTKLWRRDLAEVTGDWVSWAIPRPDLSDVLQGALRRSEKTYGYNPDFLYPKEGGIDHLPRSIANSLPEEVIQLETRVTSLQAEKGQVTIEGPRGERTEEAPVVLSSLPLQHLAQITSDLPPELANAAEDLSCVSIRAINLGIRGEALHPDVQWVYVPAPEVPFHRIGIPSALAPAMAPPGHHTLVAEISYQPQDDPGAEAHLDQTISALIRMGFVTSAEDIAYQKVVDIPHAYVVFDRRRREVLPDLMAWYLDRQVIPMGRYGTWDYLGMQDCLLHGREVAQWIKNS